MTIRRAGLYSFADADQPVSFQLRRSKVHNKDVQWPIRSENRDELACDEPQTRKTSDWRVFLCLQVDTARIYQPRDKFALNSTVRNHRRCVKNIGTSYVRAILNASV